ncbi:hypothetical protein ACTQ6A_13750 [Lachnospiraceae bacterium LCP25S3_G4]
MMDNDYITEINKYLSKIKSAKVLATIMILVKGIVKKEENGN